MTRSLKREFCNSLTHALDLSEKHAMQKHRRDARRLMDMLGEQRHTYYRWVGEAKLPICKVLAFEAATDSCFITQYFAQANNKMLVDIPSGYKATRRDWQELASYTQEVLGMLLAFDEKGTKPEETAHAIKTLIEDFAYHRTRVSKHGQPDLLGE